jgi:high-affinity nickel permease
MNEQTLISLLSIRFLMGVTHAFDADHTVAVSSLAHRKEDRLPGLSYAFRWALGHGGILLLAAIAVLLFRVQMPDFIPHSAGKIVGVVLIVSGLSLIGTLTFRLFLTRAQRFLLQRKFILFSGNRMLPGIGATLFGCLWLSAT